MLNADDESILDAALRQGLICPMPAKAMRQCDLQCKVLRGKVAMETNYSLNRMNWLQAMC